MAKRKIESGTDKVMPTGKPREAVRKVSREPTAADDKDAAKGSAADATDAGDAEGTGGQGQERW